MNIKAKYKTLDNHIVYLFFFCVVSLALFYYHRNPILFLLDWAIILLPMSALFYRSYKNSRDLSENIPYVNYDPNKHSCNISQALQKIIGSEDILCQKVTSTDGNVYSIQEIADDRQLRASQYVMPLNEKYYQLSFASLGANSVLMLFSDITQEHSARKKTKEDFDALDYKNQLLKVALDTLNFPVWVRGYDMKILYCNNEYLNITSNEKDHAEYVEIDDICKAYAARAIEQDMVQTYRTPAITASQSRVIYKITDKPLPELRVVAGFAIDITYQEELEAADAESTRIYQHLLESMDDACMIVAEDGTVQYHNSALSKFWGIPEGVLEGQATHAEILDQLYIHRKLPEQSNYKEFRDQRLNLYRTLNQERDDTFYLPDGRCLECKAIPHAGGSMLFIYKDITHKLSLERQNTALSAVQKITIENLQEGVCVFNEFGQLEIINPQMKKLRSMRNPDDGDFDDIVDFIKQTAAAYDGKTPGQIRTMFAASMTAREVTSHIVKDVVGITVRRVAVPLPNGGLLISEQDMTDSEILKNILAGQNSALMHIDQIKTEFLSNITHKLRSGVTAVRMISRMISNDDLAHLQDSQRAHFEILIDAMESLNTVLDNALEIATLNEHYSDTVNEDFDLTQFIKIILEDFRETIRVKAIRCTYEFDDMPAIYIGDKAKIERVFARILENVIYRARSEGIIDISLISREDKHLICITDNGVPIQDNEPDPNSPNSIGLGVTLAHAIMSTINGQIISKYFHESGYTSFIIELPR